MMILLSFLLLSSRVLAQAGVSRCAGPVINGVHYIDEVIKSDLERPLSPIYDSSTNTVYFSELYPGLRHLAKIDLNTKEFEHISGADNSVYGAEAQSIDAATGDIYYAGEVGIFKYNKTANTATKYGAGNYEISGLSYRDGIVYFTDNRFNVYKYANGEVSRVEELKDIKARSFVIDNDGYIIYATEEKTGVFRQQLGTKNVVSFPYKKLVRGFAVDKNGEVYAAAKDGVYHVNIQEQVLEKLIDVKDTHGITFDGNNNIIYLTETAVHWFQRSEDQSCV